MNPRPRTTDFNKKYAPSIASTGPYSANADSKSPHIASSRASRTIIAARNTNTGQTIRRSSPGLLPSRAAAERTADR